MKNKLRPLAFFSRLSTLALVVALLFYSGVKAQDTLALYPGLIPNAKAGGTTKPVAKRPSSGMVSFVSSPSVEIYLPEKEKATGAAVIICPGGSYVFLAYQNEGVATAKEFQKNGVAAFVLKYRLPNDAFMNDKKIVPMMDAEQAIKVVRQNATHWGLDTHRVGLMGFSAGGHLASTVATHFKKPVIENKEHINLRPDFLILVYPVISMQDKLTHKQSRTNLLGKDPSQELKDEFSNEMQVDADTPPTYLTHAGDDKVVDVDNSIAFYESLRHAKVAAELHIYPKGDHGFVLQQAPADWMAPLFKWMRNGKWIIN